MARVRQKQTKNQRRSARSVRHATQHLAQETLPLDDGNVTTPVTLAMIRTLIPLGLMAVETFWFVSATDGIGLKPGPTQIVYGDALPGFTILVRAKKLATGCYEASLQASGYSAMTRFRIASSQVEELSSDPAKR